MKLKKAIKSFNSRLNQAKERIYELEDISCYPVRGEKKVRMIMKKAYVNCGTTLRDF